LPRGWIATANNRPAPDDFPYPLSGTWGDSQRARRIHQLIEAGGKLSRADCAAMQQDALSLRAVRRLPGLLEVLAPHPDARTQEAVRHLRGWDGRFEPGAVGATIFEVFFSHWAREVARERFPPENADFLAGGCNGLAAALLSGDPAGWFATGQREQAILRALEGALAWLEERLGPGMGEWTWGRLHVLPLRHVLSGRGDLGRLLDHGGVAVHGNMHTVCNTGPGPNFEVRSGATYRLIADLAEAPAGLWAVDSQSQSGHPGSAHYADQLPVWLGGEYHFLPLDQSEVTCRAVARLTLGPSPGLADKS
jgi:penicillin amidase